ncbi:MAG: hypothetical protein K7J47_14045 [Acidobacteria bacterium]|jgi:hypothetical protein|nr:hypothetical protein [Bryobacteraceae bacterium CoA2 C42]
MQEIDDDDYLPPRRFDPDPHQRRLFTLSLGQDELTATFVVSLDEMTAWHSKQWLSFDPSLMTEFHEEHKLEVDFIKGVARSGLSDAYITRLLSAGLEKPYCYDPRHTAFSFARYRWVGVPLPHWDPSVVVDEYVDDLARSESWEELKDLQQRISLALAAREPQSDATITLSQTTSPVYNRNSTQPE